MNNIKKFSISIIGIVTSIIIAGKTYDVNNLPINKEKLVDINNMTIKSSALNYTEPKIVPLSNTTEFIYTIPELEPESNFNIINYTENYFEEFTNSLTEAINEISTTESINNNLDDRIDEYTTEQYTENYTENVIENYTEDYTNFPKYYDNWLWVGHSRIIGMANSTPIVYLAECSIGLDWIQEHYYELTNYNGYTIVFDFGINDLGNVYNYIDFYNSLPEEFIANNYIYIMTENPVDETLEYYYGYSVSNYDISCFNETLTANLRNEFTVIDSYNYLINTGFNTVDGIHYDYDTYIKIYDYVVQTIKE